MKYLKLFEEIDLDLSDYDEDWEESPNDWDSDIIYDQIKKYVDENGLMAIKIDTSLSKKPTGNWEDFVDLCASNDIIWASKRTVEINDRALKKVSTSRSKKYLIITVYPFKTNKNRLKLKFFTSIDGFRENNEKDNIYVFNDRKIKLYSTP